MGQSDHNTSAQPPAGGHGQVGDRILSRGGTRQEYSVRLARDEGDIKAAQRLRFEVFNLELKEGLAESYATGLDQDAFDSACDHLVVEEMSASKIVGTYRLQTGVRAGQKLDYYSAQEFDLSPFDPIRSEVVELGRACVANGHRNLVVLGLLWREIAQYTKKHGARYLIGCSSLTSQDAKEGATAYIELQKTHLAAPAFRANPRPEYACPLDELSDKPPKLPRLLMAYLSIGAKICGPPAIDRHFKTIDFLTFHDLDTLPPDIVQRYLS